MGMTALKYSSSLRRCTSTWVFFYEYSYERFEGLGHLYNEHPEFKEMYKTRFHSDMPEFLEKAIVYYCKNKTTHA